MTQVGSGPSPLIVQGERLTVGPRELAIHDVTVVRMSGWGSHVKASVEPVVGVSDDVDPVAVTASGQGRIAPLSVRIV